MKKGFLVLLTLFSTSICAIDVYKCTTETGNISYQQSPCQGNMPTMLESKGIVDAESYQQSLKIQRGDLKNHQVSMLVFKWWKGLLNEVSEEFLHFKFTDNTGDTDISLLIDFIDTEKANEMGQMAVKNMVLEKGKAFERSSVSGKTNIKTMKLEDGFGYFATYKDASLVGKTSYPPGEYLNTTQGLLKKGGLLVNFTLLSNDTSAENHIFALQFLANGILIEQKQNVPQQNISLLDQAYDEYHSGSKLKSVGLFEQLVQEQPNEFKSWIGFCLALRDTNRLQMALVACDRALGFKPNDPDVLNSVMNILIKGRQYEKAMELSQELIQQSVKPQILDTINNLGFYAMIDGQLEVARKALELVKAEAGPTRKVMLDLAELDYLQGNIDQAIAAFKTIAEQTNDDGIIQAYYLDAINKNKAIHPPHAYSESYTEIPSELLALGKEQLAENMVSPWVKRFYPILGVGQLEIEVPESWAESIQLKTINKKTKQLSLVIGGLDESLSRLYIDIGKMGSEWTLSDLETQMKSSLKLYFEDEVLSLSSIDGEVKGFEYKGTTPEDSDANYIHASSTLNGIIAVDVVGLSNQVSSTSKAKLSRILGSIRLTETDQTELIKKPLNSAISQISDKPAIDTELPDPPEGFTWSRMPEAMAAILKPEGWHVIKKINDDAITYAISKEKASESKNFETGVTLTAIKDVTGKLEMSPLIFALSMTKNIEESDEDTVIKMDLNPGEKITSVMIRYENHPVGLEPIIIHKVIVTNEKTGSLYMVLFEAPKANWDEAWKMGEIIMQRLFLDDEF